MRSAFFSCWIGLAGLCCLGAVPGKKLIEYGWDVPTPTQMRDELAAMEKRPFDGLIFRLSAGHNAFVTNRLDLAKFAEDERILRSLQFTRFRDNFVLVWVWVAESPSGQEMVEWREFAFKLSGSCWPCFGSF